MGGWEPERGWSLGAGALAGGLTRCGRGVARDRWQHCRPGVDARGGALVRRRPDGRAASVPLAGFGRRAAAHARSVRRPRPGAADRRYAAVRRAHGAWLGAAPRVRARTSHAGRVREAAALRLGAGRADLRDRLHHVAIAAPTLLDPGVRRRGTNRTIRG